MGFAKDWSGGEYIKKIMADFALDQAFKYLSKDPQKNLLRIFDFAEKLSKEEVHKEGIRSLRKRCTTDPVLLRQVQRLGTNPKSLKKFVSNWVVNAIIVGNPRRQALSEELGVHIPTAILIDPTSGCNLRCKGCWAGEYSKSDRLDPELLDRVITEAKQLGIYWILFSGGEPFLYPHLLDVVANHPDVGFLSFTNGTLIDDKVADRLAELGNLSPAISLEGFEKETDGRRGKGVFQTVSSTMEKLRERGVLFGASITVTRQNNEILFSDEFVNFLIDKGAMYVWSFHYIPIGRDPDLKMMLTADQRTWLVGRVREVRNNKPILIADFWNDGYVTQGCVAGGKVYFHINAAGDVEPCAFAHFAVDNIKEKSLKEALKSPIFTAYQKRQPFHNNHLAPCPIIDQPSALREIVKESGAYPTHMGAEDVLMGETAAFLDQHSALWRAQAERIIAGESLEKEKAVDA
ncbi:MAG: radical SAM protein [Bacillota bacterium]